jgi:hypothetical protein
MANPANNTSGNQQHHDSRSEGDGGPVHDVQIGLAPTFWQPRHLNSHLKGNGRRCNPNPGQLGLLLDCRQHQRSDDHEANGRRDYGEGIYHL